jgi:hypothetical protein
MPPEPPFPAARNGRGPRWWRRRRGQVLGPLAGGVVLCSLGLVSALVHQHNQEAFRARAVPAAAVIDQIYDGAPSQGYGPSAFDQYAIVHFEAAGRTAHARVLLASNCTGTCVPRYRVGQVLAINYSPGNLTYAQLPSGSHGISAAVLFAIVGLELMGVILLAAAVINMMSV